MFPALRYSPPTVSRSCARRFSMSTASCLRPPMSAPGARRSKVLPIRLDLRRTCTRTRSPANRASRSGCGAGGIGCAQRRRQARRLCRAEQKRLEELIQTGSVAAFPDALRLVKSIAALGWPIPAAASSSKNADGMMKAIRLASGKSLLDMFAVDAPGWSLPRGKPDPAIFLLAAKELKMEPASCFVAEDAPAGMQAARAGGMTALGVARRGDEAILLAAGADVVVTSLDEVAIDDLAEGRLSRRPL